MVGVRYQMSFDMGLCTLNQARPLFEAYHGYKSAGRVAAYCFYVGEKGFMVAAYAWQPPAPGAAKSVCPEAPEGVLALSRMVAVPKDKRLLKHISKPLRQQMKVEIDRTRYPVLVTYSDESQGHTGYTYQCSGWEKTTRKKVPIYEDEKGARTSSYSNGSSGLRNLTRVGSAWIQRWEHWVCARGDAANHMARSGWRREATGGLWTSGNPAFRYVKT